MFINWSEGHPAWFAIPIALSKSLLSGLLNPLTAARLGPIAVFSIACAAVALRLKREYGTIAGMVAPIALLAVTENVFSYLISGSDRGGRLAHSGGGHTPAAPSYAA